MDAAGAMVTKTFKITINPPISFVFGRTAAGLAVPKILTGRSYNLNPSQYITQLTGSSEDARRLPTPWSARSAA